MSRDFEGFLEEYARHSDTIRDVRGGDFSQFDMNKGDRELVWDRNRHVGVMNRHNYALLFWLDYFLSSGSRPMVAHVDRHEDLAEPGQSMDRGRLKDIEYIANYIDGIKVKEFIEPAMDLGLIEGVELMGINRKNSFKEFDRYLEVARKNPVIFDLDMDVYQRNPFICESYKSEQAEEVAMTYQDSYVKFAEMIQLADLTTIAFSPDYLDGNIEETKTHFKRIREACDEIGSGGGLLSGITDSLF